MSEEICGLVGFHPNLTQEQPARGRSHLLAACSPDSREDPQTGRERGGIRQRKIVSYSQNRKRSRMVEQDDDRQRWKKNDSANVRTNLEQEFDLRFQRHDPKIMITNLKIHNHGYMRSFERDS